ncbi:MULTISPECIES: hypothetical protein [unclassified Idiomarina]|jgi:hypothetical protein|uniref:hypothetical protein n=1 Tax=unclassified Idiomarina TaxID=2614829 RepID=UPI0008F83267|nr:MULTISPECIES: hypothetical protein [unclassified Idiomarina]MAD53879.1 hypothetical protein [Idiomarinaceae bacterium]MEC7644301.1 hypothetical protein [Pseudomonadota bacterium]OIM98117.1 hypothetical protein BFR57_10400 [Idiomarina sp. MD25a]|tara:strand:+ start:241 stop:564 length:324 start_codon:yes stop_codon:yes gene_type:complete
MSTYKRSSGKGWLIALLVIGALFFAPEILSGLGFAVGSVLEFTISLLIGFAVVGLVFFVVMTVFGSVLLGLAAGFIALIFTGIGMFWPLIVCLLILYFVFRDRRKTV